jgi:hypothetical protein
VRRHTRLIAVDSDRRRCGGPEPLQPLPDRGERPKHPITGEQQTGCAGTRARVPERRRGSKKQEEKRSDSLSADPLSWFRSCVAWQVYGNKAAVDDELVQILVEPGGDDGAQEGKLLESRSGSRCWKYSLYTRHPERSRRGRVGASSSVHGMVTRVRRVAEVSMPSY